MAVSAFIPSIWSARFLSKLRDSLVWGNLVNRTYEGEIRAAGDTVKIPTSTTTITVGDYTIGQDISSAQTADGTTQDLLIDKQKYFHFKVDDVNKVQTRPNVMDDAMQEAAYRVARQIDADLSEVFAEGYNASRDIDIDTALTEDNAGVELIQAFIATKRTMTTANITQGDRWAVVHPDFIGLLENHFLSKPADGVFLPVTAESTLTNGFAGNLLGFRLYVTSLTPENGDNTKWRIFLGSGNESVTHAAQIGKVEAYRPELQFADAVKGLYVYGTKNVLPSRIHTITHLKAA